MDNQRFWNERYERMPELGSGPGSRAYGAWVKRRLIRKIVADHQTRSILDIGCGDLCWLEDDLVAKIAYCGCDISKVVIERNQARFPQLQFLHHDVAGAALPQTADLIVCFDVLIHQIERDAFERALCHVLTSLSCKGLISYQTPHGLRVPMLPDTPADVLRHEEELLRFLKDARFPRAEVAFHGDLIQQISRLAPELTARPVASYFPQTIYEVSRNRPRST
jgi:SAM-dependent methyltransferase